MTAASKVAIRVLGIEDDRPVTGRPGDARPFGLPPELRHANDVMLGTALGETNDHGAR